ncbi:hypothetical protein IGJ47_001809 [Enterococcus sp. AZ172]
MLVVLHAEKAANYWLSSDCRQTPKFGVLFAVFLFYTHCINYSGSDSNDEKTID